MPLNEEELQGLKDEAGGYYIGLWNLLIKKEAPPNIIVDASINNMLCMMDRYLDAGAKIDLLEAITKTIKNEHSISTDINH